MLSSPKCNVTFVRTKEDAEALMEQKIFWALHDNSVSEWNRKMATKHLSQTLRLAAKTAAEHPSDKFVARVGFTAGGGNSESVRLSRAIGAWHRMGVDSSKVVVVRMKGER